MGLDFKGVKVSVTSSKLPVGYVKSPITEITGEYKTVAQSFDINKNDIADVDPVTGFNNILAEIATLVQADLNANFKTDTANFEAYSDFTDVNTNQAINEQVYTAADYLLNCVVTTYIVKV